MSGQDYQIKYKQDINWQMHKLHFHENAEILLILSDGGSLFLNKDIYPLRKNTFMVLRANTLHRTEYDSKDNIFRRYSFYISAPLLKELSSAETDFAGILGSCAPCYELPQSESEELSALFDLLNTGAGDSFGSDVRERIAILRILLLVCGRINTDKSAVTGVTNADYSRVAPILDYIKSSYSEQISLDDLARRFLISKHYLCHMFKKGTGFSIMEYVIQLRILESQRLLRDGVSLPDVCERTGFKSYPHFIRTFNSYVGISPKQYEKQYRQGERFHIESAD